MPDGLRYPAAAAAIPDLSSLKIDGTNGVGGCRHAPADVIESKSRVQL